MRYSSVDVYGVYIAPIAAILPVAWVATLAFRRLANRFGLLRWVWHPALFVSSVFVVILSAMVLVAGL